MAKHGNASLRRSVAVAVALILAAVGAIMATDRIAHPRADARPATPPNVAMGLNRFVMIPAGTNPVVEIDHSILNLTGRDITVGTIDPVTGNVANGEYLLYVSIDFGDAPLANLGVEYRDAAGNLVGTSLDSARPRFEAVMPVSNGPWLLGQNYGSGTAFKLRPSANTTAPVGAQGSVTIRTALVTSTTPDLRSAPGAAQEIRFIVSEAGLYQQRGWDFVTVGGANARAKR